METPHGVDFPPNASQGQTSLLLESSNLKSVSVGEKVLCSHAKRYSKYFSKVATCSGEEEFIVLFALSTSGYDRGQLYS